MVNLKDTCAIVGVGETKFVSSRTPSGKTSTTLHLEAAAKAIEDAGLNKDDIDGLLTIANQSQFIWSVYLGNRMWLPAIRYSTSIDLGGASSVALVQHAVMAINAGLCDTVVCVHASGGGVRAPQAPRPAGPPRVTTGSGDSGEFEQPFGNLAPMHNYALACRRHMYEYGTTNAQLGAVAMACRKHATLNENAQQRAPMTLEDYFNSKMYCEPFRLFDICQTTEGACAVVVTSAERAKTLKHRPIYISGMGSHHPGREIASRSSLTTGGGHLSGKRAYEMAGMTPKDMDAAEIYDCFTYTELEAIEDYGFCKKGEGGPFVEGGRIELGGVIPVNTHGGLLSQGHIMGFNHITEAVRQLRGDSGAAQVKGAEVVLVSGNGGALSSHDTIILRR